MKKAKIILYNKIIEEKNIAAIEASAGKSLIKQKYREKAQIKIS